MRFAHVLAFVALACASLVGCARTEKFDITVRNDTGGPVTIALTKDGPPFERMWAGPEDLAIESPKNDEQHGYAVLPPGRSADVSVQGKFDRGTRGYVRVYRGEPDLSGMVAIGPVSPNRLDVPLRPGANQIVIGESQGRLVQQRGGPAADVAAESEEPAEAPTTQPASPAAAR
jgi:hypothetical protein